MQIDRTPWALAVINAMRERPARLPQWVKDVAVVKGIPLRKRGRPKKRAP
jgi:hypothetical protein